MLIECIERVMNMTKKFYHTCGTYTTLPLIFTEIEISEMKQELTFPQNSKLLIIEDQQVLSGM
jgi:hypothetical protein